jgi:hypothetical protein
MVDKGTILIFFCSILLAVGCANGMNKVLILGQTTSLAHEKPPSTVTLQIGNLSFQIGQKERTLADYNIQPLSPRHVVIRLDDPQENALIDNLSTHMPSNGLNVCFSACRFIARQYAMRIALIELLANVSKQNYDIVDKQLIQAYREATEKSLEKLPCEEVLNLLILVTLKEIWQIFIDELLKKDIRWAFREFQERKNWSWPAQVLTYFLAKRDEHWPLFSVLESRKIISLPVFYSDLWLAAKEGLALIHKETSLKELFKNVLEQGVCDQQDAVFTWDESSVIDYTVGLRAILPSMDVKTVHTILLFLFWLEQKMFFREMVKTIRYHYHPVIMAKYTREALETSNWPKSSISLVEKSIDEIILLQIITPYLPDDYWNMAWLKVAMITMVRDPEAAALLRPALLLINLKSNAHKEKVQNRFKGILEDVFSDTSSFFKIGAIGLISHLDRAGDFWKITIDAVIAISEDHKADVQKLEKIGCSQQVINYFKTKAKI